MLQENTPYLETERLILRRFCGEDINEFFAIFSDTEVNRFLPMFPLKDIEEAKLYLKSKFLDFYRNNRTGYRYAVCLKDDNKAVGYVQVNMASPSRDMGYGLIPRLWRQGITAEAASAVAQRLKKDGVPYITATHDVNNPASGAVMRKIGMRYCYSYEEQWQPKNFPVVFRLYQLNLDGNEDRVYMEYWNKYSNHFIEEL